MSAQYPTVKILNLHMTGLTQPGALSAAHHLIALRRPAAIYTPNAEMAERAARDPSFAALLNRADLLLPDGVGITAAARLCGKRLTRMPGIDFAEALLASAPPKGYRLFLLGAEPGVAVRAAHRISERFPRIRICGAQNGFYPAGMEHAVVAAIRLAKPDLLFVCLGSPRQELFIDRFRPPCLSLALGGALDVFAGVVPRAPEPMRRVGLEWLFRTLRQPSRIPRLAALPIFTGRVLLSESRRLAKDWQTQRKMLQK